MKIAYFGTGLLGAGFVRRLLENGHTVHVWNRSPSKAQALEADGAVAFADAAAAARGVEQIHLTLADDASVDAVLEPLAAGLDRSIWIVDHTTTAPTPTAERVARWRERNVRFVHAPVFMGPANTREGTGFMLLSTTEELRGQLEPLLATMTGKVLYLGTEPSRAAAFKLFGNMMILITTAGLADVKRFGVALGITPADAMALFDTFNPGAAMPVRAGKIGRNDYTASFELAMARKDLRLMTEEAARHGAELGVVAAAAVLFDAALTRGDGKLDASAVANFDR